MLDKKVSLIVLTHNQLKQATKPFIKSLYENTDENDFELIIVDNASTDGTIEYLQKLEKEKFNVRVIYNDKNLGYSKGNNQGIKIASGEYIGLLNNDIYLEKDWLGKLIKVFEIEDNAGLVSPVVMTPVECSVFDFLNKNEKIKKKYVNNKKNNKVLDALFCCVFFKKQLTTKIGLLDENFSPAWFEDNDYSFRFVCAGFYNYICSDVVIFHNHSRTSSQLKKAEEIIHKNKNYYFEKHNYFAQYCWEENRKFRELNNELTTIKKSWFFFLVDIDISLRKRFEKIFRGILKRL